MSDSDNDVDPKDELGQRFNDRVPGANKDEQNDDEDVDAEDTLNTQSDEHTSGTSEASDAGNTQHTSATSDTDNTQHTANTSDVKDTGNTHNTGDASEASDTPPSSPSKPGPDRDENATRHRKQVPMYLSGDAATAINQLYERLDGRSKVAGEGGIEKHADFMETLVEFAVENEDDLAARLQIDID